MSNLHVFSGAASDLSDETRFTGGNLRTIRRNRGLTQIQLADLLNVTQPMISRWESGIELPSPAIFNKMTGIFLNRNGILNRSIDRLVVGQPSANIFGVGKSRENFLHVGDSGCRFHKLGKSELLGRSINEYCESDWKADILGDRPMEELVSWQYSRDLVPKPGSNHLHVRIFANTIALEMEGHDRIHVSLAHLTHPTGEPPQLIDCITLEDLRPS